MILVPQYSNCRDLDVQFFSQFLLSKHFNFLSVCCDQAKFCKTLTDLSRSSMIPDERQAQKPYLDLDLHFKFLGSTELTMLINRDRLF